MRFIPAREDVNTLDPYRSGNTLQWDAIESVPPGQVLVVDSRGDTRAASGGDMLMTRAWKRGVAGVVTDGGLRDGHVLSQLPFPTYAAAITITTRAAWHHVADLQVPIGCAGVAVYPGDVSSPTATGSSSSRARSPPRSPTLPRPGEPGGLRGHQNPGRRTAGRELPTRREDHRGVQGHPRPAVAPPDWPAVPEVVTPIRRTSHKEEICPRPNVFRRPTPPTPVGGIGRPVGEWAMISSSTVQRTAPGPAATTVAGQDRLPGLPRRDRLPGLRVAAG